MEPLLKELTNLQAGHALEATQGLHKGKIAEHQAELARLQKEIEDVRGVIDGARNPGAPGVPLPPPRRRTLPTH